MSGNRKISTIVLTVFALLVVLQPGHGRSEIRSGLSAAEADGFLLWLHSLEKASAGRQKSGQPEDNLLYPFGLPIWQTVESRPYRHLAISKAVSELEGRWRNRDDDIVRSPLLALAHARNYMQLTEHDSAQVWFRVAARLDTAGNFRREIGRESLVAAIASGDSLTIATHVTNTLGASDLTGRGGEVVLAFRWLLTQRDSNSLELLLSKVSQQRGLQDDMVRFWRAYSLAWLGRRSEALAELRTMITTGGLSRGLNEAQRRWVLLAIADLFYLQGDAHTAGRLYDKLASSELDELRSWGSFQRAALDFAARRYLRASVGYEEVCQGQGAGPWLDHACTMAEVTRELARIKAEGLRYGVTAYGAP